MQTNVLWSWELPEKISGTIVVCDTWAATTNIPTFLSHKVADLYIVNANNVKEAAKKYPHALKVGESSVLPEEFFDATNFPHEIAKVDLAGKTVLYMSNNGSRVIELAFHNGATEVSTVSFTNLSAVANWLKRTEPEHVILTAAGEITHDDQAAVEDWLCVETLEKCLKGEEVDWESVFERTREHLMQRYVEYDDKRDRELIFDLDRDDIVPICRVQKEGWIKVEG